MDFLIGAGENRILQKGNRGKHQRHTENGCRYPTLPVQRNQYLHTELQDKKGIRQVTAKQDIYAGLAIILFISHTRHTRAPARGKQSLAWSDEEDKLLAERFGNDSNITQVAKLNFRTYM